MTNLKRLGVGLAAAALLFGLAGLQASGAARAQTNPPAVFTGTVTIDGEEAAAGVAIVAMMGDTTCATGQTGRGLNNAEIDANRYALQVQESDCNGEISFMVGDAMAAETAQFSSAGLNTVNLTAMSAVETETPTEPPAMETETPTPEPTPEPPAETETPEMPAATATPSEPTDMEGPDVGTGLAPDSGSSATTTLAAALGALALVTMLGGYALARRRG